VKLEGKVNDLGRRIIARNEEVGKLGKQRDRLASELDSVVTGLNLAVEQVASGKSKFFSILNGGDPINKLQSQYGWKVWSDNSLSRLGYYLHINHDGVNSGEDMLVSRLFEVKRLQEEMPKDWSGYLERSGKPLLALDYTYFGLLADEQAPVGGVLYRKGGRVDKFHEPLREWAKKLGELFRE